MVCICEKDNFANAGGFGFLAVLPPLSRRWACHGGHDRDHEKWNRWSSKDRQAGRLGLVFCFESRAFLEQSHKAAWSQCGISSTKLLKVISRSVLLLISCSIPMTEPLVWFWALSSGFASFHRSSPCNGKRLARFPSFHPCGGPGVPSPIWLLQRSRRLVALHSVFKVWLY